MDYRQPAVGGTQNHQASWEMSETNLLGVGSMQTKKSAQQAAIKWLKLSSGGAGV